jgi:N-acetyl-gamma-glutamyl-phosphate reductase
VKFYKNSAFVKVQKQNTLISSNDVINTNDCKISVCKTKYKNKAIILSSIDNLIKGGAGQAIQNMNILYNFDVKEGLR